MSRIHIGLVVKDLDKAKSFYNALFGEAFLTSDQHFEYGEDTLELKLIRERVLR